MMLNEQKTKTRLTQLFSSSLNLTHLHSCILVGSRRWLGWGVGVDLPHPCVSQRDWP